MMSDQNKRNWQGRLRDWEASEAGPAASEQFWQRLEKELPVAPRRKRGIAWWWSGLFIGLFTLLALIVVKPVSWLPTSPVQNKSARSAQLSQSDETLEYADRNVVPATAKITAKGDVNISGNEGDLLKTPNERRTTVGGAADRSANSIPLPLKPAPTAHVAVSETKRLAGAAGQDERTHVLQSEETARRRNPEQRASPLINEPTLVPLTRVNKLLELPIVDTPSDWRSAGPKFAIGIQGGIGLSNLRLVNFLDGVGERVNRRIYTGTTVSGTVNVRKRNFQLSGGLERGELEETVGFRRLITLDPLREAPSGQGLVTGEYSVDVKSATSQTSTEEVTLRVRRRLDGGLPIRPRLILDFSEHTQLTQFTVPLTFSYGKRIAGSAVSGRIGSGLAYTNLKSTRTIDLQDARFRDGSQPEDFVLEQRQKDSRFNYFSWRLNGEVGYTLRQMPLRVSFGTTWSRSLGRWSPAEVTDGSWLRQLDLRLNASYAF